MNQTPIDAQHFLASENKSRFELYEHKSKIEALLKPLQTTHKFLQYYTDIQWYVHHGDLVIDNHFDNNISLIVIGDLTIHGNYNDNAEGGGYLVCTGNMRVDNVLSLYYFSVGQSLYVKGFVGAHYNDFTFRVYGETFLSRAHYSQDRDMYYPDNEVAEIYYDGFSDTDWQCEEPFTNILSPKMSRYIDADYEELTYEEAQQQTKKGKQVLGQAPEWIDARDCMLKEEVFKQPFKFSKDPDQINKERLRFELLQDDAPTAFFDTAFKNKSLHLDLAHNKTTPESILIELAKSDNVQVKQAVASNTSTPIKTLLSFCNEEEEALRIALVFNKSINEDIVKSLLDDKSINVQRALAGTKHILGHEAQFFNSTDAKTRQNYTANPNITAADRLKMLSDPDAKVKKNVLKEISPTHEIISKFIISEDPTLQCWAIKNMHDLKVEAKQALLTEEQMLNMLQSENRDVRAITFRNLVGFPFLSYQAFEKNANLYAKDELEIARIRTAQISRDEAILTLLSQDKLSIVRNCVVENFATSESILMEMNKQNFEIKEEIKGYGMSKREQFVLFNLIKNPYLPESAFPYIRKIIPLGYDMEAHPNFPPSIFLEYINYDDPYDKGDPEYDELKKAIALNGDIVKQMEHMAKSSRSKFINLAALNPHSSLETLTYIAKKHFDNYFTMEELATNKSLGKKDKLATKIINKLAGHKEYSVRSALLTNPHISLEQKMKWLDKKEIQLETRLMFWQMYGVEI